MTIEAMIEKTIGVEGKFSNHPSDLGGPTMWGITEAKARKHGFTGDMRTLPREKAVAIYRQEYAIDTGFAAVAEISQAVGEELFDSGVNFGPHFPAVWFQEWLNAFNRQGKLYADIAEDGKVGPGTLAAFRAYMKARGLEGEIVMLKALNCSQGERYKVLARARAANEDFAWGWVRERVA